MFLLNGFFLEVSIFFMKTIFKKSCKFSNFLIKTIFSYFNSGFVCVFKKIKKNQEGIMDHLSATLVAKSLNFHGQPLFSIWQGERGDNDLMRIGLISPDFSTYQARQKNLAFQDRAKRLKLHQFIAKKANALFDASLHEEVPPNSNFQNDGKFI